MIKVAQKNITTTGLRTFNLQKDPVLFLKNLLYKYQRSLKTNSGTRSTFENDIKL